MKLDVADARAGARQAGAVEHVPVGAEVATARWALSSALAPGLQQEAEGLSGDPDEANGAPRAFCSRQQ